MASKRNRDGGDTERAHNSSDEHHKRLAGTDGSIDGGSDGSYHDDEVGHCHLRVGDYIDARYRFIRQGGKGTFGLVLLCEDEKYKKLVAVKVVRKIRKYLESARAESCILRDLVRADPDDKGFCVRILNSFEWRGHFCIVFEPLGISLYDLVKANHFNPMPLYAVQAFADQVVAAVVFLHRMGLIHTDLKLENILLGDMNPLQKSHRTVHLRKKIMVSMPMSTSIKLIDFGGAAYFFEQGNGVICTRQYRAPEIILNFGWGRASDVWSLGCILMELYTGNLLFQTVRQPPPIFPALPHLTMKTTMHSLCASHNTQISFTSPPTPLSLCVA